MIKVLSEGSVYEASAGDEAHPHRYRNFNLDVAYFPL